MLEYGEGMKAAKHEHVARPPVLLQLVVSASHGKGFCTHRSLTEYVVLLKNVFEELVIVAWIASPSISEFR